MFLFMALPSGCSRAAPKLRDSTSMRKIRAARSARCDRIPTSAATPREQLRKAVQAPPGAASGGAQGRRVRRIPEQTTGVGRLMLGLAYGAGGLREVWR